MSDEDKNRLARARDRYQAAMHGVQSGVAHSEHAHPKLFSPKNTRVGITSCQVTDEGLATLLLKKGIITEVEYHEAVADAAEREKKRWEEDLSQRTGIVVRLG